MADVDETGPGQTVRLRYIEAEVVRMRATVDDHGGRLSNHGARLLETEKQIATVEGAVFGDGKSGSGILQELVRLRTTIAICGWGLGALMVPILVGVVKAAGWIR